MSSEGESGENPGVQDAEIGPDGFSEVAKEAVKDGAKAGAKEGAKESKKSAVSGIAGRVAPTDPATALLKGNGGGVEVPDVMEKYGCSEGTAYVVRGITRALGTDSIPPIVEIGVGVAKSLSGGSK